MNNVNKPEKFSSPNEDEENLILDLGKQSWEKRAKKLPLIVKPNRSNVKGKKIKCTSYKNMKKIPLTSKVSSRTKKAVDKFIKDVKNEQEKIEIERIKRINARIEDEKKKK